MRLKVIRVHGFLPGILSCQVHLTMGTCDFSAFDNLHSTQHYFSQSRSRSQNRTEWYVKPNASLKIYCVVVNRESASALASSGAAQAAIRVPRTAFLAINLKLSVIMVSIPFSLMNNSYIEGTIQKYSPLLQNLFQNLKQTRR
jgi:hypothetical protein